MAEQKYIHQLLRELIKARLIQKLEQFQKTKTKTKTNQNG